MKFNKEICKVLHPEMNNPKYQYRLRPTGWKAALQERPWGSRWTTSWLWASKVTLQQRRPISRAALGKAAPSSKSREVIRLLSSAPVRLHLQCWVQSWALQYKRDMDILGWDQQRATMTVKGLENLSYEERLKEPGLFSLEKLRRILSMYINTWCEGVRS